jgi:hypothetical protein
VLDEDLVNKLADNYRTNSCCPESYQFLALTLFRIPLTIIKSYLQAGTERNLWMKVPFNHMTRVLSRD